jgi:hypothetical protein
MHLSMHPLLVNLCVFGFICCEKYIGVFRYLPDFDHPKILHQYSNFSSTTTLKREIFILTFSSDSPCSFIFVSFRLLHGCLTQSHVPIDRCLDLHINIRLQPGPHPPAGLSICNLPPSHALPARLPGYNAQIHVNINHLMFTTKVRINNIVASTI